MTLSSKIGCKRCSCKLQLHENSGGGRLMLTCWNCRVNLYIYWRPRLIYLWSHELPVNVNLMTYVAQMGCDAEEPAEIFAKAA